MKETSREVTQENKRGASGTQIVEQNNYYGMDYQSTKSLCLDLIRNEISIYKDEAEIVAIQRDEALLEKLFEKLKQEKLDDDRVCEEFKNPDMQYTYVEAQKAYIRLGTHELENLLAELLVGRIKENKRTLLQIALGEAITVVPMLLPEQINILALCFILRYTRFLIVNNMPSFLAHIQRDIMPFVLNEMPKESLFQHLVYAKTGSIELGEISLSEIIKRTYGGLFLKGYVGEEIQEFIKKYPQYFTRCIQDNSKYQVNAINQDELQERLKKSNLSTEDVKFIEDHFVSNIMSNQEIQKYLCKILPSCEKLFKQWDDTSFKHFTLTSVGIVLGANQAKRVTNEKFDLGIWI